MRYHSPRARTRSVTFMMLATVCVVSRDLSALQQSLNLSATIGKEEFFEDEPIYALFQLTNTGSDTAWLGRFEFMPGEMDLTLIGSDGAVVPRVTVWFDYVTRSEEHTSELQSRLHLVCRLLLEKKKNKNSHPD